MKVLHVIPSLAVAHGGPSRAVLMMEKALQLGGAKVHIATTDDDGPGLRLKSPPAQPGVVRHWFAKRTEFYKVAPALGDWLSRHVKDFDLLHIHALFSYTTIAAARAAHKAGVPYILRPLGTLNRYGMEQRRPWLKRVSLRLFDGPALERAAAVHFTAVAELEEAQALGIPFRPVVVPLAVEAGAEPDHAAFFARFPALRAQRYVLFLSRVDPKKNIESLLEGFSQLGGAFEGVRLAIVGDGDPRYVGALKERAATLRISDKVVWTGFLDGSLKASALQGAEVFALPSFSENFGIAAAEALLAGLPCVLGRGIAIAEEVERAQAGVAIEPTAQATAAALRRYLADGDLRRATGEAARAFAQREYSMQTMGARLLALYGDVLSRHRAAQAVLDA